jgi:hypothetical protein
VHRLGIPNLSDRRAINWRLKLIKTNSILTKGEFSQLKSLTLKDQHSKRNFKLYQKLTDNIDRFLLSDLDALVLAGYGFLNSKLYIKIANQFTGNLNGKKLTQKQAQDKFKILAMLILKYDLPKIRAKIATLELLAITDHRFVYLLLELNPIYLASDRVQELLLFLKKSYLYDKNELCGEILNAIGKSLKGDRNVTKEKINSIMLYFEIHLIQIELRDLINLKNIKTNSTASIAIYHKCLSKMIKKYNLNDQEIRIIEADNIKIIDKVILLAKKNIRVVNENTLYKLKNRYKVFMSEFNKTALINSLNGITPFGFLIYNESISNPIFTLNQTNLMYLNDVI